MKEGEIGDAVHAEADREALRLDWLARVCHVPSAYTHATREGWETSRDGAPTPWPTPVDEWVGDPPFLVLSGEPGNGKTHVATAIILEWQRRQGGKWGRLHRKRNGYPDRMIFVSVPTAVGHMRRHFENKDGGYLMNKSGIRSDKGVPAAEFYARIMEESDLVILDDFGGNPDTSTWWDRVNGWVYDRHRAKLPTVITQNPSSMGSPSDHVARRITDGIVVTMPWKEKK